GGDDRLLIVNLGPEVELDVAPEPLLAPPAGLCWRLLWSSEDPRYGGGGTPVLGVPWRLGAESTLALWPEPRLLVAGRDLADTVCIRDTPTGTDARMGRQR